MQSDDAETGARHLATEHGTADSETLEEHVGTEEHVHLPAQSIWPITTAFGTAVAGFGLVSAHVVSLLGLGVMAWGIIAWVQELRHERH
jgi:hypothetical protein